MANKVMNGIATGKNNPNITRFLGYCEIFQELSGKPWIDVKQSRNPFEIRGKK